MVVSTVTPGGKPVALKLECGGLVAVIWYENRKPTAPPAVPGLVITGGPRAMFQFMFWVSVPEPLPALMVPTVFATTVGVPVMRPDPLIDRPGGKLVAPKDVGPLSAVIW